MTHRYTQIDPHDALYISVQKTPGGVEELAAFMTNRRGVSMHAETLRQKLRKVKGQSMSLDLFELATEWMMEKQGGEAYARDWLLALNLRHGVSANILPPAPSTRTRSTRRARKSWKCPTSTGNCRQWRLRRCWMVISVRKTPPPS